MKVRLLMAVFSGLFITALVCFITPPVPAANISHITCEDGELFSLKEWDAMETSNMAMENRDLIIVETHKLRLTLYRDGKMLRTYPVAIGTSKTPSPIGEWKIIHKGGNWGDGFGVRWIGLNVPWGIYGIHGTNKPSSIGFRSSHGCIRMFNRNVLELYDLIKVGTPVHIIGDLPKITPRREMKLKNTGKDIVAVQFALRRSGFNPGNADGRFGILMEQAASGFQRFYGLAITGKIGPNEQYLLKIR